MFMWASEMSGAHPLLLISSPIGNISKIKARKSALAAI